MGDERDTFAGLRWEKEIRILGDPHIPLNHRRNLNLMSEIEVVMTTS